VVILYLVLDKFSTIVQMQFFIFTSTKATYTLPNLFEK